jgi:DNA repair exonuclease SbcCD ATPase subunit
VSSVQLTRVPEIEREERIMIKKLIVTSLAVGALGTFVFGRDMMSYVRTCGSSVRSVVKQEVPLDFEVQRAREMVENLVPDIHECVQMIAEQQVEIDYLTGEIASKEQAVDEQKSAILALRNELRSGKQTFSFASRTYTPIEVKQDLEKRFRRFKAAEDALKRERQILDARTAAVEANQDKLNQMLSRKQELEVELAQLEARLKTVQAAESVSNLEFDDTRLARARKLIHQLNRQLDVRERVLDAEGKFTGLIPVEVGAGNGEDVTSEIDEYFGGASHEATEHDVEIEVEPSA